jgi:adenylate cyclase
VLEGSVQRDQNRVRVNAQLIDAETGAHIWADRFEEDLADLFKLQDQVVARLANALNYELVRADAETAAHSKNPDLIDLDMRGTEALWRFQQQPTKDGLMAIRALFEQALKIDPDDPEALGGDAAKNDRLGTSVSAGEVWARCRTHRHHHITESRGIFRQPN